MKVSKAWLDEWVSVKDVDRDVLSEHLTMAGLEVDEISQAAGAFSNVVVGFVTTVRPHPDAKRLNLCEVDVGEAHPLKIVCGASNISAGIKVAVAKIGAELPGAFSIKETEIRGEPSFGMICSTKELGIEDDSEGIWVLPDDVRIGACLREALALDDSIYEIGLTPNRGDCLSIQGVAREVSALLNRPLKKESAAEISASYAEPALAISIAEPEFCSQYLGCVIEGVNGKVTTPLWMSERLRRLGVRPKSFLVDVTNYVMLELGQPMHAFDLDKIEGDITVRKAHDNESLVLLTDKEVSLKTNTVVIADSKKALAIAGVMGGASSAVSCETTNIFLESASFSQQKIAGVARQYGIHTDASHRFERGVAPELAHRAMARVIELILETSGGNVGPIVAKIDNRYLPAEKKVAFSHEALTRLLGYEIAKEKTAEIFASLGMHITDKQNDNWTVIVPAFRFDIHHETDLIEEVARIYGYNNIPAKPTLASFQASPIKEGNRTKLVLANYLVSLGYHEVISYSFVCPNLQRNLYGHEIKTQQLLNPISPELSDMRVGLWPGLLNIAMFNLKRQQQDFKLFETGLVFLQDERNELQQKPMIAGLLVGNVCEEQWSEKARLLDFFDLKGDVEAIIGKSHLKHIDFKASSHTALHPGQQAKILYKGQSSGYLGLLHPKVAKALGITDNIYLFELDLSVYLAGEQAKFEKISKFPLIRRDLCFIVNKSTNFSELKQAIKELSIGGEFFQSCDVFDVYEGKGIPEGKKSLAVSLILQHPSRTLVDNEVNEFIDAILKKLERDFNIILRE